MILGGGYNNKNLSDMWAFDTSADKWLKLKGEVPQAWYVTGDIIPDAGFIVLTTATKAKDHTRSCDEVYTVRTTYGYQIRRDGIVDQGFSPPAADRPAVGAPGRHRWSLEGLSAGSAALVFVNLRPWEDRPVREHSVAVTVR